MLTSRERSSLADERSLKCETDSEGLSPEEDRKHWTHLRPRGNHDDHVLFNQRRTVSSWLFVYLQSSGFSSEGWTLPVAPCWSETAHRCWNSVMNSGLWLLSSPPDEQVMWCLSMNLWRERVYFYFILFIHCFILTGTVYINQTFL